MPTVAAQNTHTQRAHVRSSARSGVTRVRFGGFGDGCSSLSPKHRRIFQIIVHFSLLREFFLGSSIRRYFSFLFARPKMWEMLSLNLTLLSLLIILRHCNLHPLLPSPLAFASRSLSSSPPSAEGCRVSLRRRALHVCAQARRARLLVLRGARARVRRVRESESAVQGVSGTVF